MSNAETQRLLLADVDPQAALEFRAVAEAYLKLQEQAAELYVAVGQDVPRHVQRALDEAKLEYKRLNRVCLRHAARRLDLSLRAEGQDSEMESAVMMFDIRNPVVAGA